MYFSSPAFPSFPFRLDGFAWAGTSGLLPLVDGLVFLHVGPKILDEHLAIDRFNSIHFIYSFCLDLVGG